MITCPICGTKWLSGMAYSYNPDDSIDERCFLCWGLEEPETRLRNVSKETIEKHKEKLRRIR